MKKLFCLTILVFCSLFLVTSMSAQCQGNYYITSFTWQTANTVQGFTSTELDYCAGLYYDPAVSGSLTEVAGTGTAVLGQSYTQGSAHYAPAIVELCGTGQ